MKKILTREEQAQPLSAKKFLWLIFLVPATHAKIVNQIHESVGGDIFEL